MELKTKIITAATLFQPATDASSEQKQKAFGALVNGLYRRTAICITGTAVNTAVLVLASHNRLAPGRLAAWGAIMAAGVIFRILAALNYKHKINSSGPEKPYLLILASIVFIGFAWASATFFLIPPGAPMSQAMFVVIILCGMCAGALGVLVVPFSSFLAFNLPVLSAVIIRFATMDHYLHLYVVAAASLFLGLTTAIALKTGRDRYRLHLLNTVLEEKLEQRTRRLQAANQEMAKKIKQLKKARQMLEQERDRLETITGNIGAGLAVISRDFKILWANRVLKEIFGSRVEGRLCYNNFNRVKTICSGCGVARIFEGGMDKVVHELESRDKRGNHIWFQIIATPIKDSNQNITAALELVLPITEKKRAEAMQEQMARELEQVRKIEAIATLAGGIAHQFNNALTAVLGNIELLQLDYTHDNNLTRYTGPILESAARMTEWTRQLLAYAEGGKYSPRTVSLADFIKQALPLLRHSVDRKIDLVTDLAKSDCPVHIDLTQMQMVISSVVANAAEAIDGIGVIKITCHAHEIPRDQFPAMDPKRYVCLGVVDNGAGMDEETRKRVFEPFFTTKFYGRGLGMAAVYGIIKNHGGYITIDSESGRGTSVSMYLPRARKEEARQRRNVPAVSGSGTILLIEDETLVRQINQALLERLGYEVLTAIDGSQALDLAKNHKGRIDLALLDIKLPDIDGAALFPKLCALRPQMKVIVCSGYALDGPTQEILDAGADDFIQKPFSMADIAAKIEKVIRVAPPA